MSDDLHIQRRKSLLHDEKRGKNDEKSVEIFRECVFEGMALRKGRLSMAIELVTLYFCSR